jgi:hypothetical protein
MKNLLKKSILFCATVSSVLGLSFTASKYKTVKAQSDFKFCDYVDYPGSPTDGCKVPVFLLPCVCDSQC